MTRYERRNTIRTIEIVRIITVVSLFVLWIGFSTICGNGGTELSVALSGIVGFACVGVQVSIYLFLQEKIDSIR